MSGPANQNDTVERADGTTLFPFTANGIFPGTAVGYSISVEEQLEKVRSTGNSDGRDGVKIAGLINEAAAKYQSNGRKTAIAVDDKSVIGQQITIPNGVRVVPTGSESELIWNSVPQHVSGGQASDRRVGLIALGSNTDSLPTGSQFEIAATADLEAAAREMPLSYLPADLQVVGARFSIYSTVSQGFQFPARLRGEGHPVSISSIEGGVAHFDRPLRNKLERDGSGKLFGLRLGTISANCGIEGVTFVQENEVEPHIALSTVGVSGFKISDIRFTKFTGGMSFGSSVCGTVKNICMELAQFNKYDEARGTGIAFTFGPCDDVLIDNVTIRGPYRHHGIDAGWNAGDHYGVVLRNVRVYDNLRPVGTHAGGGLIFESLKVSRTDVHDDSTITPLNNGYSPEAILLRSPYNVLKDVEVNHFGHGTVGVDIVCGGNKVLGGVIRGAQSGVTISLGVDSSASNVVQGVVFEYPTQPAGGGGSVGVNIRNRLAQIIRDNTILGHSFGILAENSSDCVLMNNIAQTSGGTAFATSPATNLTDINNQQITGIVI